MKKIIFDLDNTLLFLSEEWTNYYQDFIDKYKLSITPNDLFTTIGKIEKKITNKRMTKKVLIEFVSNSLAITFTEEMLDDFHTFYLNIPLLDIDTTYDTLSYLSKSYELIAYSNWFTDNQINRLKKHNLYQFFKIVYGGDILPIKPSIKGIKSIVKNNNIEEYTFIGDSIEIDLKLPNELGMNTILLNRKHIKQDKYPEIYNLEELKDIL